ncbi:MAG: hypothetical protein EXS00_03315 [Phycisphaerales bacterium]|nr:hypothetical protein [Phycisphaerales bacterium]
MQDLCRLIPLLIVVIATGLGSSPFAAAQSSANATPAAPTPAASDEKAMLEADLEAAYLQIDYLERRIAALEGALRSAKQPIPAFRDGQDSESDRAQPTDAAGSGQRSGIDSLESASRSSDDVVAEYRALYQQQYSNQPIPPVAAGKAHTLAINDLRRFANHNNNELFQHVRWTVRVMNGSSGPRKTSSVQAVVVNASTGETIGFPFDLRLDATLTRKIATAERGELFILDGMLQPTAIVVPSLDKPTAFEGSPFIGPYLEFKFTLNVRNLIPHETALQNSGDAPATAPPAAPATGGV